MSEKLDGYLEKIKAFRRELHQYFECESLDDIRKEGAIDLMVRMRMFARELCGEADTEVLCGLERCEELTSLIKMTELFKDLVRRCAPTWKEERNGG